jgi:esterase/lipase superfamily enzyme
MMLYRMAQITWDLQFRGTAVLFSWPSRGEPLAYAYDQNSAFGARDHFIELIRLLKRDANIKRIHVIAHCMGNMLVLDALANHACTSDPVQISELVMAAPDVDQHYYVGVMNNVQSVVSSLTLYASSADKAMVVSRHLAMAARVGEVVENRPVLVGGVDAIDVTVIGDEISGLNHNLFASNRALMNDIKLIISKRLRPPHDRLAEIRAMPEGAAQPLFWRYAP